MDERGRAKTAHTTAKNTAVGVYQCTKHAERAVGHHCLRVLCSKPAATRATAVARASKGVELDDEN
jgi:hypothetical protein